MERKTLGITGVVLALGALMRTGGSDAAGKQSVDTSTTKLMVAALTGCDAAQAENAKPEGGPLKILGAFPKSVCAPGYEFLIATVPDPIATDLALDFDRAVESIIWAAEESRFSLYRRWLPWKTAAEKELPLLSDRRCQKIEADKRSQEPGLLAFSGSDHSRLFVFLVGEGPTTGVNHDQWKKAVEYVRGLSCNSKSPIRVVGPSFSGSLATLQLELRDFGSVKFDFASGMATSERAITDFKSEIAATGSSYVSTIETDKRAMELFFGYAATFWRSRERVALLTEEGTVYGSDFAVPLSFRTTPDVCKTPRKDWQHRWFTLRYPREISRLRNAYQEEKAPTAESTLGPTEPALRLTLKDGQSESGTDARTDGVPAFSRLQSPASQEAVMNSIAGTVRRERADLVGIVATDVLDTLFISRYLRTHCPDTRLFTPDADLLFATRSDGDSLEGLLSITTYPLFSRNQHWTDAFGEDGDIKGDQRIPFASRYSQGIYNASRYLLDRTQHLKEYTRPGEDSTHPPLWLTVMGRDGYWPVALLDERQPDSPYLADGARFGTAKSERIHPEAPGKGWYLVYWLTVLFSGLHAAYLWRVLKKPEAPPVPAPKKEDEKQSKTEAFFGLLSEKLFKAYPKPGKELTIDQRVFLTAASLSVGSMLFLLSVPLLTFPDPQYWMIWYVLAGCLAFTAQLAAATALSWSPRVWQPDEGKRRPSNTAVLAGAAWGLSVLVAAVWATMLATRYYRSGLFLAYRCFSLTSGVAPNVPVLLLSAALFWWAVMQLSRATQVENRAKLEAAIKDKLPGDEQMKDVDHPLRELFSKGVWLPALPFLVVWLLLFVPWRTLRTFEFARYDWMVILLLSVVYWAIATAWMQFLWCWKEFKVFLQWLERQPIAHAFSRLRKEISWVPLVSRPPEHPLFISTRAWQCLNAIQSFEGSQVTHKGSFHKLRGEIKPKLQAIGPLIQRVDDSLGGRLDEEGYRELQQHLQAAARIISDNLAKSPQRWYDPDAGLQVKEDPKKKDEKLSDDERLVILQEEFVAYRYLIFIRYVFRNLRNLLGFIIAAFILSVLSLSSYPFQGHRWIGLASTFTFLALGTGIAMVLAGMDRDAILSRITNTDPNEIGPTFFLRLAQFGALPLLTLLASQFPGVSHFLFSWVRPALESLK